MREWPLKMINYLTGFLLLSSLHCMLTAVVSQADIGTFYYGFVYLPIVILLSVSQKKAKYFWQYAVAAVLALGLEQIVIKSSFEKSLGLVLTLLAVASFFYARAVKKDCWLEVPVYPFLALYIIMYLLELRFHSDLMRNYAVFGAGIYYLLCMYQTNFDEMQRFMDVSAQLERFPMKRLVKSNYLMMGFQTVIVAIGMCIASAFGIDGILHKFSNALHSVLAWLLQWLESDELEWGAEGAAAEAEIMATETKELSAFMKAFLEVLDVFAWILVIAITAFVVYLILKMLYQLYLQFDMNSAENGDQIEQLYEIRAKDEKKALKKSRKESLFWDRSPNARIRKAYKKRILKERKEAPRKSMTPAEIEQGIIMEEEQKNIFHKYYEKARYGNVLCTKEEAQEYRF